MRSRSSSASAAAAGLLDDGVEAPLRVLAQEVAVELVLAGFLHRPPGEHVGDPGVVVGVVVDDLPQIRGVVPVGPQEIGRHQHLPLVLGDLVDHPVQRAVRQHEDVGLVHRWDLPSPAAASPSR